MSFLILSINVYLFMFKINYEWLYVFFVYIIYIINKYKTFNKFYLRKILT